MSPPIPIRNQKPLEKGGTVARKGFIYQDHVAAGFAIALTTDPNLKEVWCETQDDITLIWAGGQVEFVEFVQVKSHELEKLWSVAEICKQDGPADEKKIGSSILESSFANDRNTEESHFRLVTLRAVSSELRVLTYPKGSPARANGSAELDALHAEIDTRLPHCSSPKNNNLQYWLRNVLWEVKDSEEAVRNCNLIALRRFAESIGATLFSDQVEELYQLILGKVQAAAAADWSIDPDKKKLIRKDFCDWLRKAVLSTTQSTPYKAGKKMREKMEAADLPTDYIKSADIARRAYRKFLLNPTYQKTADLNLIETEIVSKLHHLRSQLDAGLLTNQGIQFHTRCMTALEEIRAKSYSEIPLFFFQGCMHNITDRCLHRFLAVAP